MENLMETAELMCSKDYKLRFLAEYWQLKIRLEGLHRFIIKIVAAQRADFRSGKIPEEPKHDCPLEMLEQQERIMREYRDVLEQRAILEGINLSNPWAAITKDGDIQCG